MNIDIYKLGDELDSYNYREVQDGIHAVLDMTACKYVSSTGLRVLLYSKKVADSKGLKFYLVGISDDVQDVMSVTGFDSFFDSFNTIEECLEKVRSEK